MNKKAVYITLLSTIVGISSSYAVSTSTEKLKGLKAPANFKQIIQTVNLLANTNLDSPAATATPIKIQYFTGSTLCWDTGAYPINYQNFDSFGSCPSCGCRGIVSKVVVTPQAPIGKINSAYAPYTIDINTSTKITGTQLIIFQDKAPRFNPNNGEIEELGTIQVKKQEQ